MKGGGVTASQTMSGENFPEKQAFWEVFANMAVNSNFSFNHNSLNKRKIQFFYEFIMQNLLFSVVFLKMYLIKGLSHQKDLR